MAMPFGPGLSCFAPSSGGAGSRPLRASIPIAGAPPDSRRFDGHLVARSPRGHVGEVPRGPQAGANSRPAANASKQAGAITYASPAMLCRQAPAALTGTVSSRRPARTKFIRGSTKIRGLGPSSLPCCGRLSSTGPAWHAYSASKPAGSLHAAWLEYRLYDCDEASLMHLARQASAATTLGCQSMMIGTRQGEEYAYQIPHERHTATSICGLAVGSDNSLALGLRDVWPIGRAPGLGRG